MRLGADEKDYYRGTFKPRSEEGDAGGETAPPEPTKASPGGDA
jgi:hypothetical protein